MALHIPSNLYSGNAVVLDTRQPMQYYMQRMATQQAKNQALDSYYDKLHTAINPAGMRVQDIEGGFNKEIQDWRSFYNENKAAIKDPAMDNGKAYNEHMSRYQSLLGRTEASKDAAKKEMALATAKLSGKWDPTDSDLDVAHKISSSIYSPDHYKDGVTPYGIEDVSVSHPDFTPQLQNQFLKGSYEGFKPAQNYDFSKAVIDKKSGKQTVPYEERFSPEQLRTIGDRAGSQYEGSKPAKKFFETAIHEPAEYQQLNEAFKSVYGRDITTPREAAQGWAIANKSASMKTGERLMNWTDPNKSFALKAAGFEYSKKLADYKKSIGVTDNGGYSDPIEPIMQRQEEQAKAGGVAVYKTADGKEMPTYIVKAPPELKQTMAVRDGATIRHPDEVRIADNGDYIGIFYKKYPKGDPKEFQPVEVNGMTAVDASLPPVRISREDVKLGLGKQFLTKKANQQVMESVAKPKSAPVKTKPKNDPLGIF